MISVIVPYKNAEPWFTRCLESLRCQEGDFEFLVINDSSTDKSEEIAKWFAGMDDRFVLLDNEHAPGVSGARNTGLDHAKGEWITFLDADDEMLEYAILAFENALGTPANIHQLNHARGQKFVHKYINDGGFYGTGNLPQTWWGVWNKLIRRDFLEGIRFYEGLQYGEDGLFVLDCLDKDGKIHHTDRKTMSVRHRFDNENSLSHIKTFDDILKNIRTYEDFMFRQDDPKIKRTMCLELSKLWKRQSEFFE